MPVFQIREKAIFQMQPRLLSNDEQQRIITESTCEGIVPIASRSELSALVTRPPCLLREEAIFALVFSLLRPAWRISVEKGCPSWLGGGGGTNFLLSAL